MSIRTIRSRAQRQILVWLRHGSSTVSDIAERFSMRMPHASLACRQMREAGLVSRDERGGLRNAPIYLTKKGHERLLEDAVGKMLQYSEALLERQENIVLHADETNVLLAYIEPPQSSFVFVENPNQFSDDASTGNRGGAWVLAPPQGVRWFNIEDGSPAEAPLREETGTLTSFELTQRRVGLVRGEVFERRGTQALMEGQGFVASKPLPNQAPLRLRLGDLDIGEVKNTGFAFAPPMGLNVHLKSTVSRNLLLQSLSADGLEIGDRLGLRSRDLPFPILHFWLTRKHPRMNNERIRELYLGLRDVLSGGKVSDVASLEREVRMEFGETNWTDKPLHNGYLDTYGLSPRAISSIMDHVLESVSVPFLLDWAHDATDGVDFKRLMEHPQCRAVFTRRKPPSSSASDIVSVLDGQDMGAVEIQMGRSIRFDVELHARGQTLSQHVPLRRVPSSALELLAMSQRVSSPTFTALPPTGEQGERLQEAVRVFPDGDEDLANGWEATDPLSAWIATPAPYRHSRWVRLQNRLPNGWVELMPVDALPLRDLPIAMAAAGENWRTLALHHIRAHVHHDATNLHHWRQQLGNEHPAKAAFATCLLSALNPGEMDQQAAYAKAMDAWFEDPMCQADVLEFVFGSRRQDVSSDDLETWKRRALSTSPDAVLHVWASALDVAQQKEPWTADFQRTVMQTLPDHWWSVYADQWLRTQLASHTGRTWLESFSCSWLAQLARVKGERSGFPGLDITHQGFSLTTESLMAVRLLKDGVGTPSLIDLHEIVYANEQSMPVPTVATHPQAGWLVRPVEEWPAFGGEVLGIGDRVVGELLFLRSFHARVHPPTR